MTPTTAVTIGGFPYALKGLLAATATHNLYCGYREAVYPELVVVKEARNAAAEQALMRTWDRLTYLSRLENRGASTFGKYVPQLVSRGPMVDAEGPRGYATVHRWRSGFLCTLDDVRRAHPAGVTPRTLVWVWKRCLEQAGWLAESGYAHGQLTPENILVHPRDHGVVFCGYSHLHPGGRPGDRAPNDDLLELGRTLKGLLGGAELPTELGDLLYSQTGSAGNSAGNPAWRYLEQVGAAARRSYGPSAYEPLPMPGWPPPEAFA